MRSVFFLLLMCISVNCLSPHPKVLLISLDGFRFDLLNETMVPNIYKWAKESVWFVNGSQSEYVSFTAPNHMSMVTGLHQESHGIVSNLFYDKETNQFFDYFNYTKREGIVNASLSVNWYKGEPIWLTNERAGSDRKSATFYWPNGEATFPSPPHHQSFHKSWVTYRNMTQHFQDIDDILDAFMKRTDPVNFVAWYIAEPDHTLHSNGFYNGALKDKLKELDQTFSYLLAKLRDFSLHNTINVILTADHGHSEIIDYKHIFCLKDYISGGDFEMGDHMIYPKNSKISEEIYQNLTKAIKDNNLGIKIYKYEDFPDRFHYKNSSRIGDILLEPMLGSSISFSCSGSDLEKTYGQGKIKFNSSTHGMDPSLPDMRPILVMNGPAFAKEKMITEIPKIIDIYSLLAQILQVPPAPHNGTLNVISHALQTVSTIENRGIRFNVVTDNLSFMILLIPPTLLVLLFMVYGCKHTILQDDPQWATPSGGYRLLFTDSGPSTGNNDVEHGREAISMSGLLHQGESSEDEF